MVNEIDGWLKPEDALTRFKKPGNVLFSPKQEPAAEQVLRYGYKIENTGFLIAQDTLSEIVKNTNIFPVPNTKSWMKGLVNLRGNLIPVYDLSLLLGGSKSSYGNTNLLILGKDIDSVGILIEGLPQPCDTSDWQKLSNVPLHLTNIEDHIIDAYTDDDMVWMDFNQRSYFESIKDQVIM